MEQSDKEVARLMGEAFGEEGPLGCFDMGSIYYYDSGVETSYSLAYRWMMRATDDGEPWAEYYLGSMYYREDDIPKSYIEAFRFYSRAADQGCAEACYMLEIVLELGIGVERSGPRSRAMYCKAAILGDSDSECDLKMYYCRIA